MRKDEGMSRFTPPTPRSRRLGRELRRLRDARDLNLDVVGKTLHCSGSRISRIESGEIKARRGDVMELLLAYQVPLDGEQGKALVDLAGSLRESGWWQRLDALTSKYATYIAYEAEALELRDFQPTLVPGLLQTEAYAREVVSVEWETNAQTVEQLVSARITRQQILKREPVPLRVHAILSEAALRSEVGGPEILRSQLQHIVQVSRLPNVTVQVLRFAAGAHLADRGGFAVLTFGPDEPTLGYIETLAGELFLESSKEIDRLHTVHDQLKTLAMSPAESVKFIREQVE